MNSETPNYWVFYHRSDLDGLCSGAICKYFLEERNASPIMRGIDYGDVFPFDEICPNDIIYMVDFCLQPENQMKKLEDMCGELIWIDHHKSSIETLHEFNCPGIRQVGKAACELCWEFLYPDDSIPESVKLLSRYDVWDQSDKQLWDENIYPFQMGMRTLSLDPINEIHSWINIFKGQSIPEIMVIGRGIVKYQNQQNIRTMMSSFEVEFDGKKWIAVNAGGNSQIFESRYDPEKHHGMLGFTNKQGKFWTISLYSTRDDIDVSEIAKRYGGGGHKGAAGFQCYELPFPTNNGGTQ